MEDRQRIAREDAIKNIKSGLIAAMIVFGINLGQYLIAKFGDVTVTGLSGADVDWFLVDLGLLFLLIWGVSRYSRFAATFLFIYFLGTKIIQFLETGSLAGLVLGVIILFFFARAVQGAFDYHQLMKSVNPDHKPTKKWMLWVGIPVFLVVGSLAMIGVLSHYEIIPASHVTSSSDLTEKERKALIDMNIIDAGTHVEFFYSYGLFSYRDGGVVMTDDSVIVFAEVEGEMYFDSMLIEDMEWVKKVSQGDEMTLSHIQIAGKELYQGLQFELSPEGNMDTVFVQTLENKINPPVKDEPVPLPTY